MTSHTYSNIARFVDELLPRQSCDGTLVVYLQATQPLYAMGPMYTGTQFTTVPPTIYYYRRASASPYRPLCSPAG
jgi:hypothetical protein